MAHICCPHYISTGQSYCVKSLALALQASGIVWYGARLDLALTVFSISSRAYFHTKWKKTTLRLNSCCIHTTHTHLGIYTYLEEQSPPPPHVYTHLPYMYTSIFVCVRITSINREGILPESFFTVRFTFLLSTLILCLN